MDWMNSFRCQSKLDPLLNRYNCEQILTPTMEWIDDKQSLAKSTVNMLSRFDRLSFVECSLFQSESGMCD